MLTENLRKCELSIAYLHTICAKCGFTLSEPRIDNDSVDVFVNANGKISDESILHSPMIHVQLKATTDWELKGDSISFFLKEKNYEDLRANCVVPKLLIILCLPESESDWVSHSPDELILRKCAYWTSLKGFPKSTTVSGGATVYLKEMFTPDLLIDTLLKISKDEW